MTHLPTLRSQAHWQGAQTCAQSQPCQRACLRPRARNTLLFLLLALVTIRSNAQTKVNYNIFSKTPLGNIQINLPQPATMTPVDLNHYSQPLQNNSLAQLSPLFDYNNSSIQQRNYQMIEQDIRNYNEVTLPQQEQQMKEIENDMMGITSYREEREQMIQTQSYRQAYNYLTHQNPDSFSLTKAVFAVENAYFDNKLSFTELTKAIKQRADLVKQILKREGLSAKSNLALNYGIQKLYSQPNEFYSEKLKQSIAVPPVKYDFEDFRGEKDYSKMFVYKLLATGKGQCHSMPLLYLMIAEQMGAKAELSLAPQHSFVQFADNNNRMMNFETTSGMMVSNTWLAQSGFITAQALQNKTYLDTLSHRQLYAQMLGDLLLGYLSKFPYDDFAEQMRQKILQINPNNLTAQIVDANRKRQMALEKIKAAGKPKEEELHNYPDAYGAYQDMQTAIEKVNKTGYQDMPKEAYQKWLTSIEQEKKKQANQQLKEQMQREIQQMKNIKVRLDNPNQKQ